MTYVLIVVGGIFCLMNWGMLILSWRRRRFVSSVPLVGAALLGSGLALLPKTRPFAWLAVIVDYGTLALIILLLRIAFWNHRPRPVDRENLPR